MAGAFLAAILLVLPIRLVPLRATEAEVAA
jgi:hypothetical protein